jgi:succinate dehydrogenase / fumarate reductase cytochrome b subunit
MADVNRGNRPLSPHLQIYRLPLAARMSIVHRITGVGLALTAVLVVWWFLAAATGRDYFETVDGLLTSWIGGLILIGSLAALWYHFCTGVRHLWWDAGKGFEIDQVEKSGLAVLGAAGLLTVLTLIAAF